MKLNFTKSRLTFSATTIKLLALISLTVLGATPTFAQVSYCTAGLHLGTCDASNSINTVTISGTTLNNQNTGCSNSSGWGYSAFSPSGTTTASLNQQVTYNLSVTTTATNFVSAWIDYNQNGQFEASEWYRVAGPSVPNLPATVAITIPSTALTGQTRLRIRSMDGNMNGANDACTSFPNGETEDYTISIAPPPVCSGTPTPGSITGNKDVCSGQTTSLSLIGHTLGTALQWESSPNGVTWTTITGATSGTYQAGPLTASMQYRVNVTCNGLTVPTPAALVTLGTGGITSIPHTQNFDAATVPAMPCGWTVLNANADNKTWTTVANNPASAPNALRYDFHIANAADDWAFSPEMMLQATKQYVVSFKYRAGSPNFAEGLEVKFGSAPTATGMISTVFSKTNITNISYTTVTSTPFSPAASGNYHLGFHAISGPNKFYLFVDDITISELPSCSGTPVAGNLPAGPIAICNSTANTLTATGASQGSGIVYQWEESDDDGISDPWANVTGGTGANTVSYSLPQLAASRFYRLKVTCTATGSFTYSSPVQVTVNPVASCYCSSNLHTGTCSTADNINAVSVSGTTLNNASTGCTAGNGPAYTKYPATGTTTATLQKLVPYNLNVTASANTRLSVWIDLNHDGTFASDEWQLVTASAIANTPATVSITIPATAVDGQTGMRIRSQLFGTPHGAANACSTLNTGETEDYSITIAPVPVCTSPPVPGAITGNLGLCNGQSTTLTLTGYTLGTSLQWQSSPDGIAWTDISGAASHTYATPGLISATYFRVNVTCNGNTAASPTVQAMITNGALTTFPAIQNFDNGTAPPIPCGWTVQDVNADGKTWKTVAAIPASAPNSLQYEHSTTNAANDWIFTPAITFSANKKYLIAFKHRTESIGSAQALEIKIGSAAAPASMNTSLYLNSNLTSSTYTTETLPVFEPTTTGTYHIGFHVTSPAFRYNLILDDISITEMPACSGMPTAGTIPAGPLNVCHTNVNTLTATGATQASGITYTWQESEDNGVNDPWTNVTTGQGANTTSYTLPTTLPYTNYYRLKVSCTQSGLEAISIPVEVTANFTDISVFPHTENFEQTAFQQIPCGWTVTDANNDGTTWQNVAINPSPAGPNALRYGTHTTNQANDWAFSPEIILTAGRQYEVVFRYMAASSAFPEGLEVKFGTAPTPAAMTTSIFQNPSITNMNMVMATSNVFIPPTTGSYYLGFKAISLPNRFYLVVDDVTIRDVNAVGMAETLNHDLKVYPNPNKGNFTIELPQSGTKNTKLQLFNQVGQVVYKEDFLPGAEKKVYLNNLAVGIYFLKIEQNGKSINRKIAIEK